MGFYDRYILPRVLNWSCGAEPVLAQRQKVVPLAEGRVLEVGIGSGLNLPYYDPAKVERVIGLDPAEEMLSYARRKSATLPFRVEYLALERFHLIETHILNSRNSWHTPGA
jgi:2-polyprenyl-3-methyl-5-hydroxy-6-metoxy-1,4-benzoquinol methylase